MNECLLLNLPFLDGEGELTGVWEDASAGSWVVDRPPPGLAAEPACFDRKNGDDGPDRKDESVCEWSDEERGMGESVGEESRMGMGG